MSVLNKPTASLEGEAMLRLFFLIVYADVPDASPILYIKCS